MRSVSLAQALDAIQLSGTGDEISFGDLVKALNHRGFGSLLIAPSIVSVLPTGMIPGVPAVCGGFIILISAQLLLGRKYPWLPKYIRKISFSREQYSASLKKFKPYIDSIDSLLHPRLKFLTQNIVQKTIALICIFLGFIMIVLGFIPFVPALLALTILMFGLGLSTHDGLLIAFGFMAMAAAGLIIPSLL